MPACFLKSVLFSYYNVACLWRKQNVPGPLATWLPTLQDQRSSDGSKMAAAARPATATLEAFWSCVVDGDLVLSSHERKYLALTLFLLLLPHLG